MCVGLQSSETQEIWTQTQEQCYVTMEAGMTLPQAKTPKDCQPRLRASV